MFPHAVRGTIAGLLELLNDRGGGEDPYRVAEELRLEVDVLLPLCGQSLPVPGGVDLAGIREDFGDSIGELIEAMLRSAVRQQAAEHLDGMLSEQQRIDYTVETAARRGVRRFRLRCQMPGLRSDQMELRCKSVPATST